MGLGFALVISCVIGRSETGQTGTIVRTVGNAYGGNFFPQNGYTGNLTLLTRNSPFGPARNLLRPDSALLRFDTRLPSSEFFLQRNIREQPMTLRSRA